MISKLRYFFWLLTKWYKRRFRGEVQADGGGTRWIEHTLPTFRCACSELLSFEPGHYFVRERDEHGNVISARYVRTCACGIGHWLDASPKVKT